MNTLSQRPFRHSSFKGLIGVAQEDITPPVDIYSRNWGAAAHDTATGIHKPLMLTCMTFQLAPADKPLVLIGVDLGGWKNSENEWRFRREILKALELGESHLMVCLSHTHAGPSLSVSDSDKPGGHYIQPYLRELQEAVVRAARKAVAVAAPAVLSWQYGASKLATNRDLPEESKNRFVVGFNQDVRADDTLLVGRVTDAQDRIIGTIVNYACHPTTLAWDNQLISPDYVGAMRELVESHTGAPCLFLQGASGELSPAEQYSGNIDIADKNGRQLGYAVLAALEGMLPPGTGLVYGGVVESGAALAVWERDRYQPSGKLSASLLRVPFKIKPLPTLKEIEELYANSNDRVVKERLYRKLHVRKTIGDGEVAAEPMWVWQLGDSFLVGQPNEAYSDFQEQLRRALPSTAIAVINLVNGGIGYLPPDRFYSENIYQEWQTPFAAGSLELLIDSALQAVKGKQ